MLDIAAYGVFFLSVALIYSLICLGLNLQWGFTGLFNVGVAGFFAVGAYASAILTRPEDASHLGGFALPVGIGWLGGLSAAGLAALVVGVSTLRLRHDYLAISTFGIAVSIQLVALNAEWLTGGPFGLTFIPRPFAGALGGGLGYAVLFLGLVALVLLLAYLALERLVASPWGRVLRAIREDEEAAAALGKHAFLFRLQSFVIGSALMGLAGAIYASFVGFIAPEDFLPILTFQAWTMLIIGGSGDNRGAILGGVVVWGVWSASGAVMDALLEPEMQVRGAALQIVAIGVALAAVLLVRPRGILGRS
jgi:branched-chain amino acid transport system permease protein